MTTPVIPQAGATSVIAAGGTAVIAANAVPQGINGGYITNPLSPTDQGLAASEPLYVNPVGAATLQGNGTTFALQPGQTWFMIPGQTTATSVNAVSSGHKFTCVVY